MKAITFLMLSLFLFSCEKEFEPDFSFGKVTAIKNGEKWTAQGIAKFNKPHGIGIDLLFDVYSKYGERRQRLYFGKVPLAKSTRTLTNSSSQSSDSLTIAVFNTLSSDGDVLEDRYLVIEDSLINNITILSIDSDTSWIDGEFMATFVIDPNRQKFNPNNPDTISFAKGVFKVRIDK